MATTKFIVELELDQSPNQMNAEQAVRSIQFFLKYGLMGYSPKVTLLEE